MHIIVYEKSFWKRGEEFYNIYLDSASKRRKLEKKKKKKKKNVGRLFSLRVYGHNARTCCYMYILVYGRLDTPHFSLRVYGKKMEKKKKKKNNNLKLEWLLEQDPETSTVQQNAVY